MKGRSLLELHGMSEVSENNGVSIWRPLLPHNKDEIFSFAHKYGVPYFKDTTPLWSTRGKTRNSLVPLLQDMYGAGVLNKLSELGEASKQLGRMTGAALLDPFGDRVKHGAAGCWVSYRGFEEQPAFFWKQVLKEIVHSMGVGQVGDKAIGQLIERLAANGKRDGWIPLRKESRTLILDGRLLFFRPQFFPFEIVKSPGARSAGPVFRAHIPNDSPLVLGSHHFGPWTVTLTEVGKQDDHTIDIEDILLGEWSYTVPAAAGYKISRSKPPKMFRALERAIVEQLPIVAVIDPVPYPDSEDQRVLVCCKFDTTLAAAAEGEQ
eukprot:TRINITY_DN1979_c0_g1_i4.p1 TRINITY_DN1979_c0_g1~~TRINITY_DN1979_c0_g1_i4.p1  ORF type:complete len:321 (+),score=67.77 TRINITY_DN1979_c0_g1_i4:1219-2181(+)